MKVTIRREEQKAGMQLSNKKHFFTSLIVVSIAALLIALITFHYANGQTTQASGRVKVVDSMIATVNGSLITYSDLLWQLTLEPQTVLENPSGEELRRALELVIRQRIIHQEAEKLPHIHATDKQVEVAINELVKLFPSQAEFQQRMRRTGLTSEKLRDIISERVDIENYLDFRFRNLPWQPRRDRRILPRGVRTTIPSTFAADRAESGPGSRRDSADSDGSEDRI